MKTAEKKVLLFLVEGSTDSTSLGFVMSRLVESADVRFLVLGGDICYRYRITEENAGLHFLLTVDTARSDRAIIDAADRAGIRLSCLADYAGQPDEQSAHRFVINYSGIDCSRLDEAVRRLSEVLI